MAQAMANYCTSRGDDINSSVRCSQFCEDFPSKIPYVYLGFSVLSAVCCILVFLTYFCMPRLRQSGYSSKVFLNR